MWIASFSISCSALGALNPGFGRVKSPLCPGSRGGGGAGFQLTDVLGREYQLCNTVRKILKLILFQL